MLGFKPSADSSIVKLLRSGLWNSLSRRQHHIHVSAIENFMHDVKMNAPPVRVREEGKIMTATENPESIKGVCA